MVTFTGKVFLYDDSNCMSQRKLRIRQKSCDDNVQPGRPGTSSVEVNEHNYRCIYDNLRTGSDDVTSEVRKTSFIRKTP
jgi:hypothetical protein